MTEKQIADGLLAERDEAHASEDAAIARAEKAEAELSDETKRREGLEWRVNELIPQVAAVEAERDELAARRDAMAAALGKAVEVLHYVVLHAPGYDWNSDPLYLTLITGEVFQMDMDALLARIRAEAGKAALLTAAEQYASSYGSVETSAVAEHLRHLAEEADHA